MMMRDIKDYGQIPTYCTSRTAREITKGFYKTQVNLSFISRDIISLNFSTVNDNLWRPMCYLGSKGKERMTISLALIFVNIQNFSK